MNWIDFSIIYFACGAPFAVHYFLQNRIESKASVSWLINCLVLLLWIPFAFILLTQNRHFFSNLGFLGNSFVSAENEQKIYQQQKRVEKILLKSNLEISIFDFRETVERYVGLTLAAQSNPDKDWGKEIFRAAKVENSELGTICLQRRNRKRLAFHQTEARRDFLQVIGRLADSLSDTAILERSTIEAVKLLKDQTAQQTLEKMFAKNLQTSTIQRVEYSEKDLWNPQEHKPLRAEIVSTRS